MKYFAILAILILVSCSAGTGSSLRITTKSLPNFESGKRSTFKVSVEGGTPPYQFRIEGTIPNGVVLGPDGTIGGDLNLDQGSSFKAYPAFNLVVTDSQGNEAKQSLAITVVEPSITINTQTADCIVNVKCDELIATAEGGESPYTFQSDSFREGAPPMGMIVDVNGHILGTTRRAGTYNVGVCAKDLKGSSKCGHATVNVNEGFAGTWKGDYQETEQGPCTNKNKGTLTWTITSTDSTFEGDVQDDGTTISTSCEGSEIGSYSSPGTITGTIDKNTLTGTMDFGFKIPFTATIDGSTINGKYNGGDSEFTYTGTFTLNRQ